MSIHRIVIFAVMTGYLLVNVNMQINFFAGQDIFSKYQIASTAAAAVRIAQEAYYAKTAFLLTLLVLLAFNVPFGLAFGLSFMLYAMTMLIFFRGGAVNMPLCNRLDHAFG